MNMTNRFSALLACALVFLTFACEPDEPMIENEEEVITAVTLTFFPADATMETVTYGFSDPDGDGGNEPDFSYTGTLNANATYTCQTSFANTMGSIDGEIVAEGRDHQTFLTSTANLTFTYNDMDLDGNALGLNTIARTGAAGTGNLTVTLRHEPTKTPPVAINRPALAGGETDVEVTFTATVQ